MLSIAQVITPITLQLPLNSPFVRCLLLSLATAANIGGMISPIASTQNLIMLDVLSAEGSEYTISFLQWIAVRARCHCWKNLMCWCCVVTLRQHPPCDVCCDLI
jgi:Na+/H+ antiporter NhaD/arsenite permease-like protein